MIWIGGNVPGVQTFRTGVKGVEVNAWHASHSHPGRYVSCLSSTGGVEENTVGEDLLLSYFTGFGVGFSNSSISTVNGLSLRNFWITGAMGRNSVPLYCPMHAGVMSIRDGTVDVRVSRGDAFTWPAIGIVAGGAHTVLDNLHIEGCGTAIYVEGRDAPTSVDISSIATNHLMEPGMTYFDEPFPELPPPTISEQQAAYPGSTDPWLTKYSSAVIIGRHPSNYQSSKAYNVTANIRTVRNLGRCKYLLRDHLYGEHYTPFGKGQYPNSGRAVLPPYSRGEGFIAQPATATFPYPDGTGNASTRNNLITN
jgi:hypothetical protein